VGTSDSISGGLALFAIYALLRSEDAAPQSRAHLVWIVLAWLSFAYSLLIKPQAAVLLPLLVAFAFVDQKRRRERIVRRRFGVAAALAFAVLITEPFHPGNPLGSVQLAMEPIHLRFGRLSVQHRQRLQPVGSSRHHVGVGQPKTSWAFRSMPGAWCSSWPRWPNRLALRAGSHLRGTARRLRDCHTRLLRLGDAHARALSLQRPALYDRMHSAGAPLFLGHDCALDRALREPPIQPAIPAGSHRQRAGRQRPEPLGPVDDALFAACRSLRSSSSVTSSWAVPSCVRPSLLRTGILRRSRKPALPSSPLCATGSILARV